MYQMFFIITFKRICEAIEIYTVTMVMDGYDRNLTTFHLCWTKGESLCYSSLST